MPISKYYKGRGRKVMSSMRKRYGAKQGKKVFYATANKWRHHGTKAQKKAQPKSRRKKK